MSTKKIYLQIFALILGSMGINSCSKSSNGSSTNYATQFIGTWTVTSNSCGSTGNSTFVIAAGSGTNSLSSVGTVGITGCLKTITITGTATANGFSFPSQTFTDGCGDTYTLSIAGTLSGGVLTFTETASGTLSASCTATATK